MFRILTWASDKHVIHITAVDANLLTYPSITFAAPAAAVTDD